MSQNFFVVIALAVVSVSADVSQLRDENGYLYPAPAVPFVEAQNDYVEPPNEYLPPAPETT